MAYFLQERPKRNLITGNAWKTSGGNDTLRRRAEAYTLNTGNSYPVQMLPLFNPPEAVMSRKKPLKGKIPVLESVQSHKKEITHVPALLHTLHVIGLPLAAVNHVFTL